MRIPSGKTDQYIYFVAVDVTDLKTRETGLSGFTVQRSRKGAAEVAYTTPTISEIDATNMPGVYALLIDEDTTIDSGSDSEAYCLHITHASMAPVTREIELYRLTISTGQTLTVANGAADADLERIQGTVVATPATAGILDINLKNIANATVATGTAQLGVNVVNAAGTAWGSGAITAASIASDAITAAKVADGTIDAATFATGAITAAAIAADAIGASELAADAVTEIQSGLATAANLATVAGYIDTEVASILAAVDTEVAAILSDTNAIKAKTDNLPSDPADQSALAALIDAVDNFVDTEIADIQARLPAALVSGRMDSSVGAMAANTLTASALATDAVTEIAAGVGSGVAAAVWDLDATAHQTQGTFGQAIGDPVADTNTIFKAVVTDATGATIGADSTSLLARLGAFIGTGTNTVLGWLRALARKDGAVPSDIGGLYDPATDSLEALGDKVGKSTTIVKSGGTSAAGSSSSAPALALSTTGFLAGLVSDVRTMTSEARVQPTYPDSKIIRMAVANWAEVWTDLAICADDPVLVTYTLPVVANTQRYWLPPNVGEIIRIGKINAESGLFEWELDTRSHYNPCGPGVQVRGNEVIFTPIWSVGDTLSIEYIPNGEIYPHEGSGTFSDPSTFVMDAGAVIGTLDRRENAYGGFLLRVFRPGGIVEERYVASSNSNMELVFSPALALAPVPLGPYSYEVVPCHGPMLAKLLALKTALQILADTGNTKVYQVQTLEYRKTQRAAHLKVANVLKRRVGRLDSDVAGNPNYGGG